MKVTFESSNKNQSQYTFEEIRDKEGIYRTISKYGEYGAFRFIVIHKNIIVINNGGCIEDFIWWNKDNITWTDSKFVESFERIIIDNT